MTDENNAANEADELLQQIAGDPMQPPVAPRPQASTPPPNMPAGVQFMQFPNNGDMDSFMAQLFGGLFQPQEPNPGSLLDPESESYIGIQEAHMATIVGTSIQVAVEELENESLPFIVQEVIISAPDGMLLGSLKQGRSGEFFYCVDKSRHDMLVASLDGSDEGGES